MEEKELGNRNRLLTVFVIVFIDLLGFGLILPLLPFYADNYGASPTVVGLLAASYAAAQLVGAPVLGRLSDRYGRRPVLLVSIAGTALGFLLLGLADPLGRFLAGLLPSGLLGENAVGVTNAVILGILFFSRILDGVTGGNISVAQAYITDITDEENRARGLGLIGAAFGLGFIIGPAVGGILSSGERYAVPAFFAAGLAFLNWIAVLLWLPESLTAEIRAQLAQLPSRSILSISELWRALSRPRFGPLLHIRLFYGLAFATFTGVFALYAQYRLGLDATQSGYLLAYVGLLVVLVQGVAIGRLSKRFPHSPPNCQVPTPTTDTLRSILPRRRYFTESPHFVPKTEISLIGFQYIHQRGCVGRAGIKRLKAQRAASNLKLTHIAVRRTDQFHARPLPGDQSSFQLLTQLLFGRQPDQFIHHDVIKRPFDGPVKGCRQMAAQCLYVNEDVADNKDLLIEPSIGDRKKIVQSRCPEQPSFLQLLCCG